MLQPIEITPENAREYLIDRGVISLHATTIVEPLGWGISNVVLKVVSDSEGFVFKQSLPKLRVKDDWPFDRDRIFIERDCMQLLDEILPAGSVPSVRFSDDENYVFGMSLAPPGGVLWKEALLAGQVDLEVARRVGWLLAEIHTLTATSTRARERFAGVTNFIQGRVDPYHLTAARANPDLADLAQAEVDRMLQVRVTLVHGDYSPKNIFAYLDHVLLLDFEVAHIGDPAFDTAFLLNHLVLKAIHRPELGNAYLAAAKCFWSEYIGRVDLATPYDVEAATVRELGCLLLARIDGKSRIEYITDEETRDFARGLARAILVGSANRVEPLIDEIGSRIASMAAHS